MLKSTAMRGPLLSIFLAATSLICFYTPARTATQQSAAEPKDDDTPVSPEAIQGCYELTMSRWVPDMKWGDDEAFITPPRRIQLFAERGTEGFETNGYLVRPAPGTKPSIHRGSYWIPKGSKKLQIVWSTGFSGLVMELKTSDAEVLRGKATTSWDFNRTKQTAEVTARRIPCAKH
jgi:hypothetical protein